MGKLGKGSGIALGASNAFPKTPMRLLTLSSWDVKRLRKTAPDLLEQLSAAIEERRR